MSKIALTPNASGTGTFTLAAPNSNTSRTITLPDEAGEVLVNGTNQNVGIGTSSPDRLVHLKTSVNNTAVLRIESTATDSYPYLSLKNDAREYQLTAHGPLGDVFTIYDGTAGSHRFVIDSSGNVGIGTSSPTAGLTLETAGSFSSATYPFPSGNVYMAAQGVGAQDNWIGIKGGYAQSSGSANLMLQANYQDANGGGAGNYIGSEAQGVADMDLTFGKLNSATSTGGTATKTEYMRIDSSGNLLVGTTSSNVIVDGVDGFKYFASGTLQLNNGSATTAEIARYGTDGAVIKFYKGSTEVGNIALTGSSTSYNTSSDYRLKTDAQPMTGASARVQALNPVNFEWIADGTRVDGFLAHEAQEVVPEAVTGTKDAMRDEEYEVTPAVYEDVVIPAVLDEDGNELEAERTEQQLVTEAVMGTRSVPDYQGIDQSKLVPLLTAALQEALTEISDLKARVTALEAV